MMSNKFPEKKVVRRYLFVAVLLTLVGVGVLARTAYIMFAERDFWLAVNQRFVKRNVVILPERGSIYSSDGELLATSMPEFKLYMDYVVMEKDSVRQAKGQHRRDSLVRAKADSIARGLHEVLPDKSVSEFKKTILDGLDNHSRHWPIYGNKRVTFKQYKQISQLPLFRLPANQGGFHVERIPLRANPYGTLARYTIGSIYAGKDSARNGLELAYDTVLRGIPGSSHRQKVMNAFIPVVDRPQVDGCDLITTIDVNMQDIAEKALTDQLREIGCKKGLAVVMEVKTGDVKAITNMEQAADGNYYESVNDAVRDLYEPGSVFKTASFMVAFDDGYINPQTPVNTGNGRVEMHGREMKDASWNTRGGYGEISAAECIQHSSNVGVSKLIDKYYFSQPEKFVNGLYRIGIADPYRIDIPGAVKANIRRPHKGKDGRYDNWSKTSLAWMSIGYETQVPPIRTLAFYNGIANGGRMLVPRFVKAKMRNGELVEEYPVRVVRERMCSPTALRDVQYCLSLVTQPKGSGRKAASKYFPVAGKTGTAQIWNKSGRTSNYFISFVGYFPANAPKYSCIVCMEKAAPASGGGHCGPVFRRIAEGIMARGRNYDIAAARDTLHPQLPVISNGDMTAARNVLAGLHIPYTADNVGDNSWGRAADENGIRLLGSAAIDKHTMPDLQGVGLRDAVFRLESMGLKVSATGKGRVASQSIQPGAALRKGMRVKLWLGNKPDTAAHHRQPAEVPTQKADSSKATAPAAVDTSKKHKN